MKSDIVHKRQEPRKRKCSPPKNLGVKCPHCRSRKVKIVNQNHICLSCKRDFKL